MVIQKECKGKEFLFILLAILTFAVDVYAITGPTHDKVIVCYISTWAVYRPSHGAFSIEDFDPNLCTHAVYAFAGLDITQSAIKSLDPWQDLKEEYGKGGYERLTGLKRTHPHLKVLLAIGGWNEGSTNYSRLASEPTQRGRFVKQVTSFVQKYNFDGLDLDWEYPTQRGGHSHDRENFVLLTKELREEFDAHNLLLTSAIGASKIVIDQAYDVRQLARYLDYLHIMCYDYHGSWDKKIGYNAPLMAHEDGDVFSVQYTIDYLLQLGAPAEKLVLGLPFYGRTFKTPFEAEVGAASDLTFQGPYTREDGFLGYNEICTMLSNSTAKWSTKWDPQNSQVLASSERDIVDGQLSVVTFDSSRSIANKVKFAMMKKLAGLMIWSVDTDDFTGACQPDEHTFDDYRKTSKSGAQINLPQTINAKYPLLRTINEAITLALNEIEDSSEILDNEIPHGINVDEESRNNGAFLNISPRLAVLAIMSYFTQCRI